MSAESDRQEDAQRAMQTAIEEVELATREALQARAAELRDQFSAARVAQAQWAADYEKAVADAAVAATEAEVEVGEDGKDHEDEIAEATSETIADLRVKENSPDASDPVLPGESSLPDSRQVPAGTEPGNTA